MDPSRAGYRELSRLDARRDLELHSCTRTSAWKRSGVVPTRQERASGWSRILWASECYNRAVISVNDEWLSLHDIFYGSRPRLPLLPSLQPAYHRVPRQRKTDPRARMCYFLDLGYNHGRDCYRPLDAETRRVAYPRDITWHHPKIPWITPKDIYVPMPQSVPVVAPSLAPVATSPAPAPRHRLNQRRTPRLRSPRALAATLKTRETWRCRGGRVARPV